MTEIKKEKSLKKNSIYYLLYNVINLAFPLITGIYVARVLLPDDIGKVASAQNLAQYFVILSFLGIPTYGLRELSRLRDDKKEFNKVFSELYVINFISTIIFLVIYVLLILFTPIYRQNLIIYLIAGISIAFNLCHISWLYEALEEYKFISIRNIIFKVVYFVLLLTFVKDESDYIIYALLTIVGTAGNSILNMIYLPRFSRFDFKGLQLRRHMKSICALVMVNLAIEIYTLVDITMLNIFSTNEKVAYYKYGSTIQKMLLTVVNTFTMVLIPRISYYYAQKKYKEFNELISKAVSVIMLLSFPMIVGIIFVSEPIITLLYGLQYITSASILKIFSILLLITPIGYLLGSRVLLVTGNENKMVIAVGSGAVVNFIGNLCLIPMFDEFGAAIASIIGEVVVMTVYVYLGRKYYKIIGIKNNILKILLATLVMTLYLVICEIKLKIGMLSSLSLEVIGSVIIYFGVLVVMKEEMVYSYFVKIKGRKGV